MKLPHYLVVILSCALAVAPIVAKEMPAKWASLALALVSIAGTLGVPKVGAE